jgi:Sulfatase
MRLGNPGTFGGPVDTPNYDRMASQGLRYNRFHVTARCSSTGAALLTGRNHHAVGMGGIPEFSGAFPGYSAMLPRDAAPFGEGLEGEWLIHGGDRQVAPDAGGAKRCRDSPRADSPTRARRRAAGCGLGTRRGPASPRPRAARAADTARSP